MSESKRKIVLYSDAKNSKNRFCVYSRRHGGGIYYGRFFDAPGEQSVAEIEAAKKAVYAAHFVQKELEMPEFSLLLVLYVDAQWLTYANSKTGGGKARALSFCAEKLGVRLKVKWISGDSNPADNLTGKGGYAKMTDLYEEALQNLLEDLGEEEDEDEDDEDE